MYIYIYVHILYNIRQNMKSCELLGIFVTYCFFICESRLLHPVGSSGRDCLLLEHVGGRSLQ